MKNFFSKLLGGPDLSRYRWLVFSGEDLDGQRKELLRRSLIAAAAVVVLSAAGAFLARGGSDILLERPAPGEDDRYVDMSIEYEYRGLSIRRDVSMTVRSRGLSETECYSAIEECRLWLEKQLSSGKVVFPESYGDLVTISWENSDFTYIGTDGPCEILLIAQLSCGEYCRLCEFTVFADPTDEDYMASLAAFADDFEEKLRESSEGEELIIPGEVRGVNINVSPPDNDHLTSIILLGFFAAALILFSRFDSLKRRFAERAESFINEMPGMSFQLILMLNCGLVAERALSEIILRNRNNPNPLYRALSDVNDRAEASNSTLSAEIYSYAKTTGERDFMRFATLLAEHSSSGADLCCKLEQELDRLQQDRMGRARAKVGQAETKLCFPLMLLLVVLVVITIVPALMTM